MTRAGDRVRLAVDDYFEGIVVVLVLVALVGGYVALTELGGDTRIETREVSNWESTGEFTHRATVVNGTDAFPQGSVLHNRSVYFRRVAPMLEGAFVYSYTATNGGDLTANATLVVVYRSVSTDVEGNATEYWRVERPLGHDRAGSLSPGERVRVPFSLNVTAAEQRADRIEDQLGNTPGETQVLVAARVNLSGTRNGQPVDRTRVYRLPLSVEDGVYRVEDPGPVTDSGTQQREVTVSTDPNPLPLYGGAGLFALSLGLAIGLVAAKYNGQVAVPEATRTRLTYQSERDEFDDWITEGHVPDSALEGPRIDVDSLEGLVDVAIDTDERVIEDRERRLFVVLDQGRHYAYGPPGTTFVGPEAGDESDTESASAEYICGATTMDGDECEIRVDGPDERCHLHSEDGTD